MLETENVSVRKTGEKLNAHRPLIRRKINVMDGTGRNSWNKTKLPETTKFKE